MKLSKSRINLVMVILLGLMLQACPDFIVQDLEEREAKLDSLRKNHNPNYLSKSISYEDYTKLKGNVTTNSSTEVDGSPIKFNVTVNKVSTDKFPNEVTIEIVIADTNGVYLKNIAPPYSSDYKEIWDKLADKCVGGSGKVEGLRIEEIQSDNSPNYAIAFVLDHSGSMGEAKVNKLQSGVIELIQYLKEPDMVSITKFTDEMYTTIKLTRDKFFILDSFKVVGMEGIESQGTAYYDAIEEGVRQLEKAPNSYKKIIIAFTDGEDVSSESNKDDAVSQLLDSKIQLFNVGYGYADTEELEYMSTISGGKFYMTISSREFPFVLRDIYLKLSNYFRITYTPEDCYGMHRVEIPVNLPNEGANISGGATYTIDSPQEKKIGDVVFLNIEFDLGKSSISDAKSLSEVNNVAEWMNENPEFRILVKGHTDSRGDADFNQKLSLDRANSVKRKLVELGISDSRIETIGYGETRPLPINQTTSDRFNRRTEFEIIK